MIRPLQSVQEFWILHGEGRWPCCISEKCESPAVVGIGRSRAPFCWWHGMETEPRPTTWGWFKEGAK